MINFFEGFPRSLPDHIRLHLFQQTVRTYILNTTMDGWQPSPSRSSVANSHKHKRHLAQSVIFEPLQSPLSLNCRPLSIPVKL